MYILLWYQQYQLVRCFIMRQGKNLVKEAISQWRDCYIDYQYLKIYIAVLMKIVNQTIELEELINSHPYTDDTQSKNSHSDHQLNPEELKQISNGMKELQQIQADINAMFWEAYENEIEICRQFCVIKFHEIQERYRLCQMFQQIGQIEDKRSLLIIYTEYTYIEAAYLKKMEESNLEAERKILKKHKKYALRMVETPDALLLQKLDTGQIKKLFDSIEDFYVNFSSSIQQKSKKAKKKIKRDYLRSLTKQNEVTNKDTFIFGLWVGIFVAVIVFMSLLLAYQKKSVETDPIFNRDFPTWRGIAYIIFYIWILGLNVFCFEDFMISHRIILDFNQHHCQSSTQIFKIAGLLSTIFAALFTVYALSLADIVSLGNFAPRYLVLILWGIFLVFMFNPFPVLYYKSRAFILKLFLRIVVSPFVGVPFVVAWATDQLVSLITPFEDLVYTGCYYFKLDFSDTLVKNNPCRNPPKTAVFIFATTVFMYRIFQCIRQGYDKKKYWKQHQFFNSIKYCMSLMTLILSYLWKSGNQNIFAAWLVFAITSTLYSYGWDLKIDWALLDRKADLCLLRDRLIYRHWTYYFMMIGNFVLRLAWVLTLSPNITDRTFGSPEIFRLITGALEIVRRGMWNILRIQKEHLKNCEEFKALPKIQAQYQTQLLQKLQQSKNKLSHPTAHNLHSNQPEFSEQLRSESQKSHPQPQLPPHIDPNPDSSEPSSQHHQSQHENQPQFNSEYQQKVLKKQATCLLQLREKIGELQKEKKERVAVLEEKRDRAHQIAKFLTVYGIG